MTDHQTVSMTGALRLLDNLRRHLLALDGADLNAEVPNHKALMAAKAATNADLVYSAHLAHLIEAEVLNQYHRFKGVTNVPSITSQ